jgi:trimethylamine:corrinoid methyltransferase-like protein
MMIDLNALITDLDTIGSFCVVNLDKQQNNKYHLDIIYVNVTETDKSVIDNIVGTYMGNMQIDSLLESNTYKASSIQL